MRKTKTYKKERKKECHVSCYPNWIQGVPQGGMVKPQGSRISLRLKCRVFYIPSKDGYKRFSKENGVSRKGPAHSLRESGALLQSIFTGSKGLSSGVTPLGTNP
jgi:hypothetical protein